MGEFCFEIKLIIKFFFNKLKYIFYWFLDERFFGKFGESNKKRGIFRLEENVFILL